MSVFKRKERPTKVKIHFPKVPPDFFGTEVSRYVNEALGEDKPPDSSDVLRALENHFEGTDFMKNLSETAHAGAIVFMMRLLDGEGASIDDVQHMLQVVLLLGLKMANDILAYAEYAKLAGVTEGQK